LDEILGLVQAYDVLLRHDQLRQEIRKKCAFSDFQEAEMSFPPSYKFRVDSLRPRKAQRAGLV